jgi:hypothetical protein
MEEPAPTATAPIPDASVPSPATPVVAPAQSPSIGRIVHLFALDDDGAVASHPAIVTKVHNATLLALCAFHPGGGTYSVSSASMGTSPGQWAWPPRS